MPDLKGFVDDVLNFFFGGFGDMINNWLIDLLNFVLGTMSTVGLITWNSPLVTITLTFVTTLCVSLWVFSLIFVISDFAEDVYNSNPIPFVTIIKNIMTGFLFASCVVSLSGAIFTLTIEIVNSLSIGVVSADWNETQTLVSTFIKRLSGMGGTTSITGFTYILFLLVLIIASIAYLYSSLVIFCYMFIHTITGALYIKPITQGDSTAMGFWFKTAISYNLTFIIQTFLFKCAVAFLLSSNGLPTSVDTFVGIAFVIGLFLVPKALGKWGISMGVSGLGRQAMSVANTASRAIGK